MHHVMDDTARKFRRETEILPTLSLDSIGAFCPPYILNCSDADEFFLYVAIEIPLQMLDPVDWLLSQHLSKQ